MAIIGKMAKQIKINSHDKFSFKMPESQEPIDRPIFPTDIKKVNCVAATVRQHSCIPVAKRAICENV